MRKWLIVAAVLFMIAATVSVVFTLSIGPYVKAHAISTLNDRFDSKVEFKNFHVWIFPYIRISGEDLVLRHHGRTDIPPLIQIHKFSASARLMDLIRQEKHVRGVHLEGLQITLPPKAKREPSTPSQGKARPFAKVLIDQIVATNAQLFLLPSDRTKPPKTFVIRKLTLRDAGLGQPMSFEARLTNPKPVGQIVTAGSFGPWQREDPRTTPIAGIYTFSHADLNTIKGLGGILSSEGKYDGVMERIVVDGTTSTPDFSLDVSGNPVPLETEFHSIVDGTNGNTLLQPVRARLLHSSFTASGGVVREPGESHRTVSLDVVSDRDRIEDLLRLALKSGKQILAGWVTYKARLEIPPGEGPISDRLKLDGHFAVSSATFSNQDVQAKLAELSRRGRGKPQERRQLNVLSDLKGQFSLRNSVMTLSNLNFDVPGAAVHLNGTYALRGGALDFRGSLALDASVSQMTTGIKSVLLRSIDPLFRHGNKGTFLPIAVTGTEDHPSFQVDFKRALTQNLP